MARCQRLSITHRRSGSHQVVILIHYRGGGEDRVSRINTSIIGRKPLVRTGVSAKRPRTDTENNRERIEGLPSPEVHFYTNNKRALYPTHGYERSLILPAPLMAWENKSRLGIHRGHVNGVRSAVQLGLDLNRFCSVMVLMRARARLLNETRATTTNTRN